MPELPEVETTIRDLQTKVLSRTFIDVWTDFQKMTRLRQGFGLRLDEVGLRPDEVGGQVKNFEQFKKELKNKKIRKIWRRGKNIIFELSQGYSLLIHQKLTGHLLYDKWEEDKVNSYIHLKFFLDNGKVLALSDLRKFAKVELWKTKDLKKELSSLGPEPLEKDFTFEKFREVLKGKKAAKGEPRSPRFAGEAGQRRGKIKQILMNQEIIAGIGNIYSDEVLWKAKVHPFKDVSRLTEKELKEIYQALQEILRKAIELRGESISDYRDPAGRKGRFDEMRKVYRRGGEKCSRCGIKIKRAKIGGRSAHFCPVCQKI